jgi:hypothetical protein
MAEESMNHRRVHGLHTVGSFTQRRTVEAEQPDGLMLLDALAWARVSLRGSRKFGTDIKISERAQRTVAPEHLIAHGTAPN